MNEEKMDLLIESVLIVAMTVSTTAILADLRAVNGPQPLLDKTVEGVVKLKERIMEIMNLIEDGRKARSQN